MSCSAASTVRPSVCQRLTSASRSAEVLVSTALNGSSSTIRRASCSSTRANSMRCICPPDSVPIVAVLESVQPDGGERLPGSFRARPCRCRRKIRSTATARCRRNRTRRSGNCGRYPRSAADRRYPGGRGRRDPITPASGLRMPASPAEQRRLAGAVRTDYGQQRAGGDLAIEVVHRRVPVVAERDIAEL